MLTTFTTLTEAQNKAHVSQHYDMQNNPYCVSSASAVLAKDQGLYGDFTNRF